MLYQKKYHNIGFCANNRPKSVNNIAVRVLHVIVLDYVFV